MSQKKHIDHVQAKGAQGGFSLPAIVLREANARYYLEDLSSDNPTGIVLQSATGFVRVTAIGGAILLRSNNNVSKSQAVKATATLTLSGVITPGKHASADLTVTGATNAGNGDEVVVGDETYTFVTALTTDPAPVPNEVLIGADAGESLANLLAAINGGAGEGTTYGTGTVAHDKVVASASDADSMTIKMKVPGDADNALATTTDATDWAWDGATIADGTAGVDPETVTIREETYSFVDELSEDFADAIPNQVLFGADSAAALDNLKLAVNGGATEGTNYSTGTEQPDDVLATTNANDSQVFEAQTLGEAGNAYTVSETIENGTFGAGVSTFTGGSEGANFDAFIAAGEVLEMGIDESVQAISLIALAANTDVAVVEY